MIVEELERKFYELKGKLDVGVITEEEFKAQVSKLRFQDSQDRWWMIGAQSGKWYSFDGTRWIPGAPPRDVPPSMPPPAPASSIRETKPEPPAPITPPVVPLTFPPRPPIPAPEKPATPIAPPQPEHVLPKRIARPPASVAPKPITFPRLPINGPLLIAGAAFSALIAVIVFWSVLDNVLPDKPISRFFSGLVGGGTTPVSVATPVPGQPTVSRDITALISAGDQFVLESKMDTAITQYQSAMQLAPQNALPLTRLARALAFKGQTQDAVNRAQTAVQRAANDAEAAAQFCRALTWNGQVSDAIPQCERAVQLDLKNWNAHAFLAEAYLHARRTSDAAQRAQTAVQLAPQSVEARRALAWVLTMQGQKDAALVEWKQTVTLEPDFYFRHFEFGEVLRVYFNSPADAVTEHQKAVGLYGAYIPAINRLGVALLAANRPQEAIAHFQRVITLDPSGAENYAYLGIAFGQTNRCNQAIPYFEQALRLDANNSLARQGVTSCRNNQAPVLPATTAPAVPIPPPTLVPSK